MTDRPIDLLPLLSPETPRSMWDTAIRLREGVEPSDVLGRLAPRLVDIATVWGCLVRLHVEPDGDACETGHWVEIEMERGLVWANMTGWPDRFGGAVPQQIDTELELAGWVLISEGGDPDPINRVYDEDPRFLTPEALEYSRLPARRLVAVVGEDDLQEWADLVVDGTRRVIVPGNDRWFFLASAEATPGGLLSERAGGSTDPYAGNWALNISLLLEPSDWDVAVWKNDEEAGLICCDLGLHEYHEPPCASPPPWSTKSGDDASGEMD